MENGNELLQKGDIAEWKEYSEKFHTAFYHHAQNDYLNEAAKRLRAKVEVLSCMYYQKPNVEKINEGHTAIYECVKAEEFDKAAELMRTHLQNDMVFALNAYKEYQEKRGR